MKKTKKNLEKIVPKLCWNVWREDVNTREIEEWNVFDHGRFCEDIMKSLLKCSIVSEFAEELKRDVMYYYWSRCEWEIILTDWPTHITKEEFCRLNDEFNNHNTKWGKAPYSMGVNLSVGKKVDVCDQLMLNWAQFVNYIWNTVEEKLNA